MLQTAEELISTLKPTQGVNIMQGTIAAARAHQANIQGEARMAAEYARQALKYLSDIDPVSRSLRVVATSLLGDASSMSGNLEDAEQAYLEAASIGQAVGDIHLTIVANSNLANILVEQGSLRQAARIYFDTLRMATHPDGQKSVIAGRVCVELSQVFYEWNQLEAASQYAHQSLVLCHHWGNMDLQAVGYIMLARLEHVQQHLDKMQEAMRTAEHLANDYDLATKYATWVKSALARLWIAQRDLGRASGFVQNSGITTNSMPSDGEIPYLQVPVYLILLRLHLARGDYNSALALSEHLGQKLEVTDRVGHVIENLVLQALAYQGKKDIDRALMVLEKALALAQPEGYSRVFLDEGESMAKLLFQAKSHRISTGYASELLAAYNGLASTELPPTQPLIERAIDPARARSVEAYRDRIHQSGYR